MSCAQEAARSGYTATFNDYVRRELGFKSDLAYYILGGGIGTWEWDAENQFADTSGALGDALTRNPHMRLFVASGYFDLATPYFATEYTRNHLGLDPSLRGRMTRRYYRAGHLMYIDVQELAALRRDVAAFLREAGAGR